MEISVAWYQNQPAMELTGRTYPYLISSAASLLPLVLAHRVSDVICQAQCKMKMHSPVGRGSEPPLPLGPAPQHTRNRWPPGTATSAQDVLGPWTRSRWEAPAKARYSQPKTGQPPPCPPQMPWGLHLTLTLLCPQAGPARSALGAWASPQCPWAAGSRGPTKARGEGGSGRTREGGRPGPQGAGCKQLKAQEKLQHSQANVKGQVIVWIPYILVLLIPLHPETTRTVTLPAWLTPSCHSLEKLSTIKRWGTESNQFIKWFNVQNPT